MVVTLTVKVDGVEALSGIVAGTAHAAPVGAPVHVSEAVPDMPAPPMDKG